MRSLQKPGLMQEDINKHSLYSVQDNKKTMQWHQPQITWMHLQKQIKFIKTSQIVLFHFIKVCSYSGAVKCLKLESLKLLIIQQQKQKLKSETPTLIWQQFEVVGCKSLVFLCVGSFPSWKGEPSAHWRCVSDSIYPPFGPNSYLVRMTVIICGLYAGWHVNINLMLQYL